MEQCGVPKRNVSFALPAGYSFNLDGTTLCLSVAVMSVAPAAGVRACMVILNGALPTFDLPMEGVVLLPGVDAFLDMARTAVNLIRNCLAAAVVACCEGELNPPAAQKIS